jgi:hypothetical protein
MTYWSCPTCGEENLERGVGLAKEFPCYSWHCLSCGWRGLSAHRYTENFKPNDDEPFEREPFNDWPNGQGTYD